MFSNPWFKKHFMEEVQFIGRGSFGEVFKATKRSSGEERAVKIMSTFDKELFNHFSQEIISLKTLSHPNIVKIDQYHFDP